MNLKTQMRVTLLAILAGFVALMIFLTLGARDLAM